MIRPLACGLGALAALAPSLDAGAEGASVTYLEARAGSVDALRDQLVAAAKGAEAGNAQGRTILVLEERERPGRFAVWVEGEAGLPLDDVPDGLLVAPVRPRVATPRWSFGSGTIDTDDLVVITHVDVLPNAKREGRRIAGSALAGLAGADRATGWIEDASDNHMTLTGVWPGPGAERADRERDAVRTARARLAPLLGSPYDDRYYEVVWARSGPPSAGETDQTSTASGG